ncbi:PREDICTED: uncharacterized protein LOC106805080 [Priapulus caudatus]|uniref:Uncharacterized protein LOC106805080 n=1 Tax=Priapulus caudatus TaxID=37621 RepID=A0ABM1DQ24_PRICU|nr:PREDICTED: uncharacterized protein LOC106805080 [Priapulus caudatus]
MVVHASHAKHNGIGGAVSLLTPIAGHSPLALGPQPCMHSVHACHVSKCCQPTQPHSPLLKPLRIESEHNQTQDTPPLGDPYSRPQENSITKEPPTEPSGGGKKHQWTDDLGSRPRPTGTMMSKESVSPTGRFINPSKVLQPPEISPPHSGIGYNPEMSAGEGGVIITHHQPSNKLQDNLPFEPRPQKIEGAGATALQMSSNDEPQSLPGGATQGAQLPTGPQMPTAQPQEAEEPVVVGTTSASWKKYRRKKYKKFVELRKKRSAESNMASAAVTIEILDYFIVDGSYCLNNECGPYGNYSYYIPISGFMPPIDIFLSINVTTGFDVLLCTELSMTEGASCADTGVHASMQTNAILNSGADVTQHKWLVAAPQYTRSVYTFRVAARNTPAAQLCSDAFRSEVGSAFLQYNLHFYRVCSDIDALSSTTPSSTWP